jgi:hypothetical protein
MKCSFCTSETDEVARGPAGHAICRRCVTDGTIPPAQITDARCSFCNVAIGTKRGMLRRRVMTVARASPAVLICIDCLEIAKQVLSHAQGVEALPG